jgi:hypothetical protein
VPYGEKENYYRTLHRQVFHFGSPFQLFAEMLLQRHNGFNSSIVMINNSSILKWQRLEQKQLDKQFLSQIQTGCSCSQFEAQAILNTVNRVYGAFIDNANTMQPGQIKLTVISSEARISQPLSEAPMITVTLTLSNDEEDVPIRRDHGTVALRQHRMQRVCREAIQQGGLLTVEDIANRLFNCGERTLSRDILDLKKKGITLPMRSTVKDMGRSLSHRKDIVKQWLLGKEYSQIAQLTHHSVPAIVNYVEKFKRVVSLTGENFDIFTIGFLVKISSSLVTEYQELFQSLDIVQHRKDELESLIKDVEKKLNSQNPTI